MYESVKHGDERMKTHTYGVNCTRCLSKRSSEQTVGLNLWGRDQNWAYTLRSFGMFSRDCTALVPK